FRGILRLRVNFQKNTAEIRSLAVSKKMKSLDPKIIAFEVKSEVDRLFERPFNTHDFLNTLFKAYHRLRTESSNVVLLKDVHRLLWMGKQKEGFFETSNPKQLIPYPIDEFSVDLGKLLESKDRSLSSGYICRLSLGSGGVNIYNPSGDFNAYKYIEFVKGGKDD
ncbi:unnamed protein product, partial [marine sediment metagenome]